MSAAPTTTLPRPSRTTRPRVRQTPATAARAAAEERIGDARAKTAPVAALARQADPAARPSLLDQAYRERVAAVLRAVGSVTAVDARGGRVILPGTPVGPAGAPP